MKKNVNYKFSPELLYELKSYSEATGQNMTSIVEKALISYLREKQNQPDAFQEMIEETRQLLQKATLNLLSLKK